MGHAKHKCRKRNPSQNQDQRRDMNRQGKINWEGAEEPIEVSGLGTELIEEGLNFVTLYRLSEVEESQEVEEECPEESQEVEEKHHADSQEIEEKHHEESPEIEEKSTEESPEIEEKHPEESP